jgi:hypothetical protein
VNEVQTNKISIVNKIKNKRKRVIDAYTDTGGVVTHVELLLLMERRSSSSGLRMRRVWREVVIMVLNHLSKKSEESRRDERSEIGRNNSPF